MGTSDLSDSSDRARQRDPNMTGLLRQGITYPYCWFLHPCTRRPRAQGIPVTPTSISCEPYRSWPRQIAHIPAPVLRRAPISRVPPYVLDDTKGMLHPGTGTVALPLKRLICTIALPGRLPQYAPHNTPCFGLFLALCTHGPLVSVRSTAVQIPHRETSPVR